MTTAQKRKKERNGKKKKKKKKLKESNRYEPYFYINDGYIRGEKKMTKKIMFT